MLVWTATLLAGGAAALYGVHEACTKFARNAHEWYQWQRDYQPTRDRNESYHFGKMDDDKYYAAQSSATFWSWMAKACPEAAARPQKPNIRLGGDGS